MTRLWIMSDLHLEAVRHPEAFRLTPPDFDILVVAGDVCEGDVGQAMRIVPALAGGKPAVFVIGNHEPWNHELGSQRQLARQAAGRLGVTLLDDSAAEIAGVHFAGGTLWGDGKLAGRHVTPSQPTGERIVVGKGREAHSINGRDQEDERPLVVVSHHAPHPACLPKAHRTGWTAGHAASDQSPLLETGRIALCVNGHVHHTIDLAPAGGRRIVCNAAGPRFGNPDFREDWVVEV